MEIEEIDVVIAPDGKVQIHVNGVSGTKCLDLTRALEIALGGQVDSREMTADSYAAESVAVEQMQPEHGA